ncbi:Major facilitator superfamily domain-containing protein 8 [Liparis tanakae]|uniref:Major facilitator superfamily domain-containing protein 8 n=1 Tax=Liparis tanakae TaxID=230148 RepID=A0A4Z2GLD6_9TELE|nr:Major facilitator superfamily domain-containing protein 8 [Liparis tanakae]
MLNGIEYGLGLSAFSLSGLLTGPLFGLWSDRRKTTKSIILFSNLFEIAGVGAGAGSSIFGFVTRSTKPEERAGIFAAIMAGRQAGLLVGPAFNLFLRLCDFKLGPFVVDQYTSPGIFMCLLWVLLQFVVLAFYWDVPPISSQEGTGLVEIKPEDDEEEEVLLSGSDEEPLLTYRAVNSDRSENSNLSGVQTVHGASTASKPLESFSGSTELLREEVVVLLTAQFITLFNQTALETMVTPLTQRLFSFGELSNSLMYSLCGVEVILGFFFVRWLSRKVADRVVLAVGLIICCIACIWCLIFLCNPRGGYGWELSSFVIGVFLQLLGLPFVAVAQVMTGLSYGRLTEPRVVQSAQSSDSASRGCEKAQSCWLSVSDKVKVYVRLDTMKSTEVEGRDRSDSQGRANGSTTTPFSSHSDGESLAHLLPDDFLTDFRTLPVVSRQRASEPQQVPANTKTQGSAAGPQPL